MILVHVLHPVLAVEHPGCETAYMGKPLAPPGSACLLMLLHAPLHSHGVTERNGEAMQTGKTWEQRESNTPSLFSSW